MNLTKAPAWGVVAAIWLLLAVGLVAGLALWQRGAIEAELQQESLILHRLISQRVGQHDAHLTSLSALAVSREDVPAALFLQVAASIRRFYPRITGIDLVDLAGNDPALSHRETADPAITAAIRAAVARSKGQPVLVAVPGGTGGYLLVKRSPNNDAPRFALALQVDADALMETDAAFWRSVKSSVALYLPDGSVLKHARVPAQEAALVGPMRFEKVLASQTQPLLMRTTLDMRVSDLLPADRIGFGLALLTALLAATVLFWRQASRARRAEQRARLGEHSARIAHASRVNALGEMASGIAHELTQPMTGILSQSQAGVRLMGRQPLDTEVITQILSANVAQSRRAADILARLRDWTRGSPPAVGTQDLNALIDNVCLLLAADARRHGVTIDFRKDASTPLVVGDTVEIEQVVFNLMRNALEALQLQEGRARRIAVATQADEREVVLSIEDNGPGVPPEMVDRLFEPFVTIKTEGTGLGLALCQRIVGRLGGRLELANGERVGAHARVVLPLAGGEGVGQ